MKVLFATKNEAKLKRYEKKLKNKGIDLISIKDLDLKEDVKVDENGKNALENAFIKAKTYYDATHIITIAVDDNLFIEGIPEDRQPGTNVRRVNGKRLTDDEMIEHYTNLVKEFGDKLETKWVYGMVLYDGKNKKEYTWEKGHLYMVSKPCEKRNPGYPLDSITYIPKYNKYSIDLNEEEKQDVWVDSNDDNVIDFIADNLPKE